LGQSLAHKVDDEDIEQAPGRVFLRDNSVPVIEQVESLSQSESVFRERSRFERDNDLLADLIEPQSQVDEFPNIVGFIQEDRQLRAIQQLLNAGKVEAWINLQYFIDDVVTPDSGVLNVWAGLTVEVESFLEIKSDDGCTCEFQKKIPQGADGNLKCNGVGF